LRSLEAGRQGCSERKKNGLSQERPFDRVVTLTYTTKCISSLELAIAVDSIGLISQAASNTS
jgi:hypothetical protein